MAKAGRRLPRCKSVADRIRIHQESLQAMMDERDCASSARDRRECCKEIRMILDAVRVEMAPEVMTQQTAKAEEMAVHIERMVHGGARDEDEHPPMDESTRTAGEPH